MITPEIKDHVLNELCSAPLESMINFKPGDLELDICFDDLNAILCQFKRLGFISELNARKQIIYLVVHMEAHDFLSRGGFFAHEEILKANIKKLGLELESLSKELEPKFAERAATITSIAGNIVTTLGLFRF